MRRAHKFPCSGCAAGMEFDPASGKLKCGYCATLRDVPAEGLAAVEEHPLHQYLRAGDCESLSAQALELECTACGAHVVFDPPAVAGACSFCGGNIVTQAKAADPLIAPHGVLPFAVEKNGATNRVRTWLATRWFAPNALKKLTRPEGIHGVYLPFWTFDAETDSGYRGERGDYYYVTESYLATENGRQVQRTRQVRRTRWTPVAGRVQEGFDDVLIAASRAVARKRLDALEPWDLDKLRPYEPDYLAGFVAQRYQVSLEQGVGLAHEMMAEVIRRRVAEAIGGDEQRIASVGTSYSEETFKHLLLPVWIGAYRLHGKVFQVVVNARTGEVQGERPWSGWKIAGLVIAILVAISILVILLR